MVQVDSDEEETLCIDGSCVESASDERDTGMGSGSHVQWGNSTESVGYTPTLINTQPQHHMRTT